MTYSTGSDLKSMPLEVASTSRSLTRLFETSSRAVLNPSNESFEKCFAKSCGDPGRDESRGRDGRRDRCGISRTSLSAAGEPKRRPSKQRKLLGELAAALKWRARLSSKRPVDRSSLALRIGNHLRSWTDWVADG